MAPLHGKSIIAGRPSQLQGETFNAVSPIEGRTLPGDFLPASAAEIDAAMAAARSAFPAFRDSPGAIRATFLESIADRLTQISRDLLERAHLETGLPPARLQSELDRTTGHLRMFAKIARDDSWRELRYEPADPAREPVPRPSLRRFFQPIGPVVVFGSSNFPFAYSVAGGDTASALATGNPVVVKAHEAHPGASEQVAETIVAAARDAGLPPGVFSLLQGPGKLLAVPLVTHPATRAVGFTGSTHAGRILIDAAARRPDPIPVFAEMGSLNPVVILASALAADAERCADLLIPSITTDAGQFCTKPGVILIPEESDTGGFLALLAERLREVRPAPMLHRGIHDSFREGLAALHALPGVSLVASVPVKENSMEGAPHLFLTDASTFLSRPILREEYFGPLSIFVTCTMDQIEPVLRSLGGQLTAAVFARNDDPLFLGLLPLLGGIAGRVIHNGVPTGVEVNSAIQHGGPWPACSDSRFSAVGPDALRRFIRPVAWQNFSDENFPGPVR